MNIMKGLKISKFQTFQQALEAAAEPNGFIHYPKAHIPDAIRKGWGEEMVIIIPRNKQELVDLFIYEDYTTKIVHTKDNTFLYICKEK